MPARGLSIQRELSYLPGGGIGRVAGRAPARHVFPIDIPVRRTAHPRAGVIVGPRGIVLGLATVLMLALAPRHAALATPPAGAASRLLVLADSLAALRTAAVDARWRGDLAAVRGAVEAEEALGPGIVTALTVEPLPPATAAARPAARRLVAAARLHRWTGAWTDSLASRVAGLPAGDPDRAFLELATGLALRDAGALERAALHLVRATEGDDPLVPEARRQALALLQRLLGAMEPGAARDARHDAALVLADGGGPGKTALAAEIDRLGVEIACTDLDGERGLDHDGSSDGEHDAERHGVADDEDCLRRVESWLDQHARAAGSAVVLLLAAEARERQGDPDGAEQALIELIARYPSAPETRAAWTRYLGLRRARQLAPTPEARHLIAIALDRQGARRDALAELAQLLDDPEGADLHVRARLLQGKIQRRIGQPEAALVALEAIDRAAATVRQRQEADLWRARALWSANRIDEAATAFAALADDAGATTSALIASWELARMFEDEARLAEAHESYQTLARRHPHDPRGIDAIWRAGLCAYRLGDLEAAIADLSRTPAGESADQSQRRLYWLGRVLAERGQLEEARAALDAAAASWPRDYYGWRAAQRRSTAATGDTAWPAWPPLPPALAAPVTDAMLPPTLVDGFRRLAAGDSVDVMPRPTPAGAAHLGDLSREGRETLTRGLLCLELGLDDAARRDLRAVELEIEREPEAMLTLASAYMALGVFDRAVSCGWDARQRWLGEPGEALALRALYPIAFAGTVHDAATRWDVDPLLVMALMRRESRFAPEALSPAGAHGLMQLMPRTASSVARKIGTRVPSRAELFRPEINVQLGTWYLATVLRDSGDQPDRALAAYNAGPHRVERWRASDGADDPDLFVELIGFRETRDYVRKVLNDYFYYQVIYADQALPLPDVGADAAGDHER